RDAVLGLARDHAFARAYVNSGRLSMPATLAHSPLLPADGDPPSAGLRPGAPARDAPIRVRGGAGWLPKEFGNPFTLLCFGAVPADRFAELPVPVDVLHILPQGSPDRPGPVLV